MHDDLIGNCGQQFSFKSSSFEDPIRCSLWTCRASTDAGGDRALRAASGLIHMHRKFGNLQRIDGMWDRDIINIVYTIARET